jgi:hypothetical protein
VNAPVTALAAVEPVSIQLPHQRELLANHVTQIKSLGGRMITHAIEIGRRLDACKFIVGHGNWGRWLKEEFDWSERTAQSLINVYDMAKSKSANFSDLGLPLSALYLLASPSTPPEAVDEVVERAEAGEIIKLADVQETIRARKGEASAKLAALQEHVEKLDPQPAPKKLKAIAALPTDESPEALGHAVIARLGQKRAIKVARAILQMTGAA